MRQTTRIEAIRLGVFGSMMARRKWYYRQFITAVRFKVWHHQVQHTQIVIGQLSTIRGRLIATWSLSLKDPEQSACRKRGRTRRLPLSQREFTRKHRLGTEMFRPWVCGALLWRNLPLTLWNLQGIRIRVMVVRA